MPGLLGRDRAQFAVSYCNRREVPLPRAFPVGGRGLRRPACPRLPPPACSPLSLPPASALCRAPAAAATAAGQHTAGGRTTRFDMGGLSRGAELHDLLKAEVMLRRLKRDVLSQVRAWQWVLGSACLAGYWGWPAGWLA